MARRSLTGAGAGSSVKSTVFAGVGSQIARDKSIDLDSELDSIAREIESFAVGLAAEHVKSSEFVQSIGVTVDRSSPSRRDRLVYSDDPAALSIEFGHDNVDANGVNHGFVEGLYILTRAADAVQERS